MIVRNATRADTLRAIELLYGEYLAAGFDRADNPTGMSFEFERDRARKYFDFHVFSPAAVCFVLEIENAARGILMASFANHPFCGARMAQPQGWFIEPGFRSFRAASRMLDTYEAWASDKGCAFVGVAAMGSDFHALAAFYKRRGYRASETYFLKAL